MGMPRRFKTSSPLPKGVKCLSLYVQGVKFVYLIVRSPAAGGLMRHTKFSTAKFSDRFKFSSTSIPRYSIIRL
jgi:hypothetical protein